jgi:putative transposase
MTSMNYAKNIEPSAEGLGHQYNHEHMVFVTHYRNKIFVHQDVIDAVRRGITEMCERLGIEIIEFSFGDTYDHVHMEINVPNKYSVSQVAQALKSHSASLALRVPICKSWFLKGSFWNGGYANSSVGFASEENVRNYIKKQDISKGQRKLAM